MTSRLAGVVDSATVCPIVFSVLERLKAELFERGYNWQTDGADTLPTP